MKKNEVVVGAEYFAKISGRRAIVRVTQVSRFGGWDAVNTTTGRSVRIRTAQRLHPFKRREPSTATQSHTFVPYRNQVKNPNCCVCGKPYDATVHTATRLPTPQNSFESAKQLVRDQITRLRKTAQVEEARDAGEHSAQLDSDYLKKGPPAVSMSPGKLKQPLAASVLLKTAVFLAYRASRGSLAAEEERPDLIVTEYVRLTEGITQDEAAVFLSAKIRQKYHPDRLQFVGWCDGVVMSGGSPQVLRLNNADEIQEAAY